MYGILNEENKFILLDTDRERIRVTALMLSKEESYVDEIEDDHVDETPGEIHAYYKHDHLPIG